MSTSYNYSEFVTHAVLQLTTRDPCANQTLEARYRYTFLNIWFLRSHNIVWDPGSVCDAHSAHSVCATLYTWRQHRSRESVTSKWQHWRCMMRTVWKVVDDLNSKQNRVVMGHCHGLWSVFKFNACHDRIDNNKKKKNYVVRTRRNSCVSVF